MFKKNYIYFKQKNEFSAITKYLVKKIYSFVTR